MTSFSLLVSAVLALASASPLDRRAVSSTTCQCPGQKITGSGNALVIYHATGAVVKSGVAFDGNYYPFTIASSVTNNVTSAWVTGYNFKSSKPNFNNSQYFVQASGKYMVFTGDITKDGGYRNTWYDTRPFYIVRTCQTSDPCACHSCTPVIAAPISTPAALQTTTTTTTTKPTTTTTTTTKPITTTSTIKSTTTKAAKSTTTKSTTTKAAKSTTTKTASSSVKSSSAKASSTKAATSTKAASYAKPTSTKAASSSVKHSSSAKASSTSSAKNYATSTKAASSAKPTSTKAAYSSVKHSSSAKASSTSSAKNYATSTKAASSAKPTSTIASKTASAVNKHYSATTTHSASKPTPTHGGCSKKHRKHRHCNCRHSSLGDILLSRFGGNIDKLIDGLQHDEIVEKVEETFKISTQN